MRARSIGKIAPALTGPGIRTTAVIGIVAVVAVAASIAVAPGLQGVLGAGLALLMLAVSLVDARPFIIPNEVTAAAPRLGFVHAALREPEGILHRLALAALRGGVLSLPFLGLLQ